MANVVVESSPPDKSTTAFFFTYVSPCTPIEAVLWSLTNESGYAENCGRGGIYDAGQPPSPLRRLTGIINAASTSIGRCWMILLTFIIYTNKNGNRSSQ